MIDSGIYQILALVQLAVLCHWGVTLLRRTALMSLLAWYGLTFATLTTIGAVVYSYGSVELSETMLLPQTDEAFDRMFLCLLLANAVIAICFRVGLKTTPVVHASDFLPGRKRPLMVKAPARLFLVWVFIATGLAVYLRGERVNHVLDNWRWALSGDYEKYYAVRGELIGLAGTPLAAHVENVGVFIVLPLFCLTSLYSWRNHGGRKWWLIFAGSFALWAGTALLRLQKAPIVALACCAALTFAYSEWRRGVRRVGAVVRLAGAGLAVGVVVAELYALLAFRGNVLGELVNRALFVPIHTTYCHFLVFPSRHGFLYYSGSRAFGTLFGWWGQPELLWGVAADWYIVAREITGNVFTMNTGLLGSAWAQAGYIGVLQESIVVFSVCLGIDCWMLRSSYKEYYPLLLCYFLGNPAGVLEGGMGYLLLNHSLLIAPLAFVAIVGAFRVQGVRPEPGERVRSRAVTPGARFGRLNHCVSGSVKQSESERR